MSILKKNFNDAQTQESQLSLVLYNFKCHWHTDTSISQLELVSWYIVATSCPILIATKLSPDLPSLPQLRTNLEPCEFLQNLHDYNNKRKLNLRF